MPVAVRGYAIDRTVKRGDIDRERRARGVTWTEMQISQPREMTSPRISYEIGECARRRPALPPGSHEHFTRQTIVYRIDLFPTPPPSPFPPPPPPRLCRACSHLPPSATPLSQPRTRFSLSSGLPFVPFHEFNLLLYRELRGFRVQLGTAASRARDRERPF